MGVLDNSDETAVWPLHDVDSFAPGVVWLDDDSARDPRLTGAKAANLALARGAGLPVHDGFVVTTEGIPRLDTGALAESDGRSALHDAWERLSRSGRVPLIVRSSSVLEDSAASSMAGRFLSVLHVRGWPAFIAAVEQVIASASSVDGAVAPMAVLVQPMAEADVGGVLFGLDPITGDRSTYRVSFARGLPEQIVGGAVTGTQVVLTTRGRIRSASSSSPGLDRRDRVSLARLARRAATTFGGPQDIEWLIHDGRLWLLQSRPVTAAQPIPPQRSRLLGGGPVAETFPDPLRRLELDMWLPPLEAGIRDAVRITGAIGTRTLASPLVTEVRGRVAVDLQALGIVRPRQTLWRQLDPRPPTRRLRAAWRVGRLRTALPAIVGDLLTEVDGHLAAVPELSQLDDGELLTVMVNAQQTLAALHAYEVLAGMLATGREVTATGASMALSALARARADGLSDAETIARYPVVLVLLAPAIGAARRLPDPGIPPRTEETDGGDAMGVAREALRMRVRWVHELTARAAEELGGRLSARGQLARADDVGDVGMRLLRDIVTNRDVAAVVRPAPPGGPPLPARFRLTSDGTVVPDVTTGEDGMVGVSAGRVAAEVTHDVTAAANKVLVVRTLDPQLAVVLPVVAAVVSETGSPLSHLAILAREHHVPAVVGAADAWATFRDGDVVIVDGAAGTVELAAAVTACNEQVGCAP